MRMGPVGGGGIGFLLIVLVVSWLTGTNPLTLLQMADGGGAPVGTPAAGPPAGDKESEFVSVVLGDLEDTWSRVLPSAGRQYQAPTLVLFNDMVQSACGSASSATGPFYCPGDRKVYLDLSFFRELDQRFGAPGDFAQAYVVAHEVGHHVQNLLGLNERVARAQRQVGEAAGQRAVGAARTAGRLLCRHLGASRRPPADARTWRRRRRTAGRCRDWRRPPAASVERPNRARELHARQFRAASRVAATRPLIRPRRGLRHVRAVTGLGARG